jgi:hypothetical protein
MRHQKCCRGNEMCSRGDCIRRGGTTKGFEFSNMVLAPLHNCLCVITGDGLRTAVCFGARFLVLLVYGRLCMLEVLQDRLRSGVWCIRVSGLENETPSKHVVPPCTKAVLLRRRPSLHCYGAITCLAA